MRKMRKLILLALVIGLNLLFDSGFVYACAFDFEDENWNIYDKLEPHAIEYLLEEKALESEMYKNSIGNYSQGSYYSTLQVQPFEQIYSYYCGPAVTKQVVEYLNGDSENMRDIGKELRTDESGTFIYRIQDYLNLHTRERYYYEDDIRSFSRWLKRIEDGIRAGKPSVLQIKPSRNLGFSYDVENGHYVNTSGIDIYDPYDYYSNETLESKDMAPNGPKVPTYEVRITDPYWGGFGNRWFDARDLWAAHMNHRFRSMLY